MWQNLLIIFFTVKCFTVLINLLISSFTMSGPEAPITRLVPEQPAHLHHEPARYLEHPQSRPVKAIDPFEEIPTPALSSDEYKRYGRQMILPGFGIESQLRLRNSSVLIVGLGGLGCPAAAYIAGAGVGKLGLIDGDEVETSNLHRQIAHSTSKVGESKVWSARQCLSDLNPNVDFESLSGRLEARNAVSILKNYDLILDCTDNPASRYLISDAAVLAGKPLVSASALTREGQLLVLNNPPSVPGSNEGGFCYRCVFPRPPPADTVLSCGEGGILGPIVGTMGTMMATHAIHLLAKDKTPEEGASNCFWLYNPFSINPMRTVRIKGKRQDCISCSATATITELSLLDGTTDYNAFCGVHASIKTPSSHQLPPTQVRDIFRQEDNQRRVLIDVQEPQNFSIATLPSAHNLPISKLEWLVGRFHEEFYNAITTEFKSMRDVLRNADEIYFICRHGNDSQRAIHLWRELRRKQEPAFAPFKQAEVRGVEGGIEACKKELGLDLPDY